MAVEDGIRIGRSSANTLVLESDEAVSRNHAIISRMDSGGYWLLDMGSSNGTLLNSAVLVQPARLSDGDQITIGSREIVFRVEQSDCLRHSLAGPTLINVRVAKQWLMVADIEGYTQLSRRLVTAELAKVMGHWFVQTRELVQECGGSIHKYLGDGWLASWSDESETSAKVPRCLSGMARLRHGSLHKFRVIVHYGDTTISSGRELLGADLNFAFRMEKLAATIGAAFLLSEPAVQRLALEPAAKLLGWRALKGFDGRHKFYSWPD